LNLNRTNPLAGGKKTIAMVLQKKGVIFCKLFIFVTVLFPVTFIHAAGVKVGMPAPYFKVLSGNNEELTSEDIRGKVAVIFYETKDTVERNRLLKNELNKFYAEQPDHLKKIILRVSIINCQGVFFSGIWKNNLKDNSQKEGISIYGDWDGRMFLSYGIKDKESNLLIIGKDGIISYYGAGKAGENDIEAIKNLLARLVNEKPEK
jgi:hypothetical protein